ncbi:TonB-linked outer membrane protein, SusC/RagA family [Polaribacter sp. KT25b]|uniref:SusC/RagA family TonB-linked outer membrane protein n=1 Tax=Polaribacter sp. KT25b TaxID=1855336 RepID=UPI000879F4E4|nr:TonB-dependent receptor [Polaribacter sp. KT25b]SDS58629.1 TonB-linked outer membrane protein, SusC/RagA family [Polaribacter sp. KT25b]
MKKLNLLLLLISISWGAFSQDVIKGIVKDSGGIPLPGVSVMEKGTQNGTSTDFDGVYQIKVSSNATLVFSYLGFKGQEIKVTGKSTLNVIMKEDTESLAEIVIVGYGAQKKESVLGAISQVKAEAIVQSGAANITNALSGLSAGLNVVQSSGQPGSDAGEIYIRGNSNPLILVDGVEVVGGFSNIDPRDVESISTLKDGAATAVYGIRGANGVIIITTKRGKIGKPVVSVTSEVSIKLYPDRYDSLDAYTAESARNVGLYNDAAFDSGFASTTDLNHWKEGDLPYIYPNTDWVGYTTKDFATSFNQSISVRGGTESVKYYASAGYLQEGDITNSEQFFNFDPEYKFERYSFRGNLDFTLSKTTKLKTSVSSRIEDQNSAGGSGSFLGLYTVSPSAGVPYYPAEVMEQYPDPLYPGLAEIRFPISVTVGNNLAGSTNTLKTIFSIDFQLEQDLDIITKGLKFTGKYNYISNYQTSSSISFDSSLESRLDRYDLLRDGTWDSFEGADYERPFDFNLGNEGINNTQDITNIRANLNYNRSFGKHNVSGLALFTRNKRISNTTFPYFEEAWVGRATYNYDAHYFVEFNGSYNGDETFYTGNKFMFFPSYSLGINLAKEKWVKEAIPALNNFKIRYSNGKTGNKSGLGSNRWQYLSYYDSANPRETWRYRFGEGDTGRLSVIRQTQLGNEDLTWSTVTKQNLGVEFGLFKNKITGEVEVFKDKREDQISRPSATVPAYFGSSVALPFANIGASESHGLEASLTYKNKTKGGFKYSATAIYGFYENRVLISAADGPGTPEYTKVAGKPAGASSLLQTDGYFQNIDELVNYPIYAGEPGLGDYRYIDYNANGTVVGTNLEDQIRFDLPKSPQHSFSLNLKGSYKNWSVSALINGITGHKGLENSSLAYALPSGDAVGRYEQLDYWTPTNTNASYPALHGDSVDPNLVAGTTARIISLDYIKLRSMNIGYNFNMDNNESIKTFKLYISGTNLFTFSDMKYADPEGNNPGSYPMLQRINLGLNMSF